MIGTTRPSHQRFPWLLALGLLGACSGGGGGGAGPDAAPTIVTASVVFPVATPAAGDTLLLFFSEDVALAAGRLLTDADLVLSGGASLGDVAAAPALASARSVAVTLGAGTSLVPGTTTVALSSGNDVVRDESGQLGTGGDPVVIGTSDGSPPTIGNVTIAAIDGELNGTGPAGGTLQVPRNGWTIDLAYADNGAIATARTRIAASVAVGTPAGTVLPDTDLRPWLTELAADDTTASYRVPSSVTFPAGACTLSCTVIDASGLASLPGTFACTVRPFTDPLRPFETNANPSQVWYLDTSRDIESLTVVTNGGSTSVVANSGANGRSDFEDVLHVLGLLAATPIANVSGTRDSNQIVLEQLTAELLARLATIYAGANVTFTATQPGGSFGGASSLPYGSIGHSRIALAGSSSTTGVLGIAIFDPNNATQNDDTRLDFQGVRLGIFLHTMANLGLGQVQATAFRQTFDPLVQAHGGTPIGGNPQDGQRLLGTLADPRATAIRTAIDDFARFTAVVVAHECGHSMGLVQNGAMPNGLYGNDATNFPGSSDGHIRNVSLFPSGASNVMSPALSYGNAVHPNTAFNSLNLAYLREQVFYGN
ncbi:MAG: hypothetical protein FJ265_02550 [Planctomycetes bacterium]|nr:hypothetical protein [Planctomycetota bacterium]